MQLNLNYLFMKKILLIIAIFFIGNAKAQFPKPTLSNISQTQVNTVNPYIHTFYCTLAAGGADALAWVQYNTVQANLNSGPSFILGSASASFSANINASSPALLPSTTYYWNILSSNAFGVVYSTVQSFTTAAVAVTPQLITEYNFNNTYNNVNGNTPFSANAGTSFGFDRTGNAGSALNIINTGSSATITGLPYGNSPRTISVWAKINTYNTFGYNHFYGYGTALTSKANGGSLIASGNLSNPTTSIAHLGYANNHTQPITGFDFHNWQHFIFVYNGTSSKVYLNGALYGTATVSWNTTIASNIFTIGEFMGEKYFDGALDDLKIYNYAVTDAEALNLFNSNSTISQNPIVSVTNVSPTNATSSTINYSINANGVSSTATSVINYGTSSTNLNLQVIGGNATGTNASTYATSLTGLVAGTTYFYQVVATNSFGTTSSSIMSFTQADPLAAIAEYSFDNTLNNIAGNTPFSVAINNTFVANRNGVAQKALRIIDTSTASITNLPTGTATRSVSVWAIIPIQSTDSRICYYGALSSNQSYGISVQGNNLVNFGYANDLSAVGSGFSGNVWAHIVTTFDGTTAKMYRDGIEIASGNKSAWNTPNSVFTIGGNYEIAVDDLKIYNRVLNQGEITNLYTFNSLLSTAVFNNQNLKATIYPNPTSDNFTIEMENEVKSVEIYSIQGQKMLTSNSKDINVSNLSKGMYLVRIEDSNNAVSTQKLIIK